MQNLLRLKTSRINVIFFGIAKLPYYMIGAEYDLVCQLGRDVSTLEASTPKCGRWLKTMDDSFYHRQISLHTQPDIKRLIALLVVGWFVFIYMIPSDSCVHSHLRHSSMVPKHSSHSTWAKPKPFVPLSNAAVFNVRFCMRNHSWQHNLNRRRDWTKKKKKKRHVLTLIAIPSIHTYDGGEESSPFADESFLIYIHLW